MARLKLVIPTMEHQEMIMDYKAEFIQEGDSMDGTAGLQKIEFYEDWVAALQDNSCEKTVRAGLVPSTTCMAIRSSDGRLVGMIDIRHRLNEGLLRSGGHIGYSVRKSERRNGYATEMLSLSLDKCRELGIDRVLVTCDGENVGSSRTIENNNGVLENEIQAQGKMTKRYWIKL